MCANKKIKSIIHEYIEVKSKLNEADTLDILHDPLGREEKRM